MRLLFFLSGAEALEASIAAISKYGGATAGYRTLLDALIPASEVLRKVKIIICFSKFVWLLLFVTH